MIKENEYKRAFVSFEGRCPYTCLHCYTFIPNYKSIGRDSVSKIVNQLNNETFDVVYISGHRENFIDPNQGIELGERIFEKYLCDILMTTRNVFNKSEINRLAKLNTLMKKEDKDLFFCLSIPALDSYKKLESNPIIPSPQKRIKFLSEIYTQGIKTFLTLKPLCPNKFIPIEEVLSILSQCKDYTTVALSSGIIIDEHILKRIKDFPIDYLSFQAPLMECLENNIIVQYVDVSEELKKIKQLCCQYDIPFFEHSMPAIDYVKKLRKK